VKQKTKTKKSIASIVVKLIENDSKDKILTEKLPIPKDKIILMDLNYTLISNSWPIRYEKLPEKINKDNMSTN